MRRMLAVIGAVVIIAVALLVRTGIDSDDGAGRRGGDGDVVLVCDTDLAEHCRALEGVTIRVEDSAVTAAAIVEGDLSDIDGWITSYAWYEVASGRARGDIGSAEVLATSPVVVAVDPVRADAVSTLCDGTALWRCLGENAGRAWGDLGGDAGWGPLKTGMPDADTATGLSVLTSAAIGHFDSTNFATNEFDATFRAWLNDLTVPSGGGDHKLLTTLVTRRGTYSAAGVLAARVTQATQAPPTLAAAPNVDAQVVLVQVTDDPSARAADPLRAALEADGWTRASGVPEPLLKPGVLGALHDLWKDVTS